LPRILVLPDNDNTYCKVPDSMEAVGRFPPGSVSAVELEAAPA